MFHKLRSVQVFMQFMAAKKGRKFCEGLAPAQLQLYAACLVQSAWRRKMAYRAAVKRRRLMRFLEYLRSKDPKKNGSKKAVGFLEGKKKKKVDSRDIVCMEYLTPTSRYPTSSCLQQLNMQQVQKFLFAMLHRVFKGALCRFQYKKKAYSARHGEYLRKIVKVQAFQRGRVVRKQVPHSTMPRPFSLTRVQVMERRRNARLRQLAVRMFKQAECRCFNLWRGVWQECRFAFYSLF
jgi:hypothetical protein